jgi:L-ribulose-5-phosphate 3-epimerase
MTSLPNRRDLLKLGGGAMAAAAIAPLLAKAADDTPTATTAKKRPLKKAVMWNMIGRNEKGTVLEKFKMLKEAGFDGVELNCPGNVPLEEYKNAVKETGVLVEGVVDSVHWNRTLSDPRPAEREFALNALRQALKDCKETGGTSVLLVPGVVKENVSYVDCYKRSQEEIRKAVPLARELGVKIAIEDVWNHFLLSPMEAARYVDEFEAPDAVGWHMDIGNILAYGWAEHWIYTLGHRIVKTHFKEFSRKKQMNEGMGKGFSVELLEGDNNWPAIMKALDDVGYHTWACLEVGGGDLDRLKFLSERLDRILAM